MTNDGMDGEWSVLHDLRRFLASQGELDADDRRVLRRFLADREGPLSQPGWDILAEGLRQQGQQELADELAGRIWPDPLASAISVIQTLAPEGLNTEWAVFVGAGGSKPSPTDIPLVSELLPTLWEKATEVNAKHLLDLRERCDALEIRNIEDLLTAIDITRSAAATPRVRGLVQGLLLGEEVRRDEMGRIRLASAPSESGLVERLQESMQTLFSLLVGRMRNAPPNAFHDSLAKRSRGQKALTVITTNYDICVERPLDSYRYGGIHGSSGETTLLKLHGSLNWFACGSCDEVVAADLVTVDALAEARLYPVVSQCPA